MLLQAALDHPFFGQFNRVKYWLLHGKCLYGSKVSRLFHNDSVTFIQQDFSNQVKRLLGAGGDEDMIYGKRKTENPVVAVCDILSEFRQPGSNGILEYVAAVSLHNTVHGF